MSPHRYTSLLLDPTPSLSIGPQAKPRCVRTSRKVFKHMLVLMMTLTQELVTWTVEDLWLVCGVLLSWRH